MPVIKYIGGSHFRELSAEDLHQFGVDDFEDTTWAQGEPTEVSQDVFDVLLEYFGDEFVSAEQERVFVPRQRALNLGNLDDQLGARPDHGEQGDQVA
jgi:hypothetical protein